MQITDCDSVHIILSHCRGSTVMLGMRGEEGHWFRPWWEAVNRAASLALAITSKTEPVAGQR